MSKVDEILEQLYSDGSYDEEFPIDPKRYIRVKAAKSELRKLIERMKKVDSWAENKSEGHPLVATGYNQAISELLSLFEEE